MKLQIALAAVGFEFAKKDRVVCKIDENEWYLGTLTSVTAKKIKLDFDDGHHAVISPEDFGSLKKIPAATPARIKKLTNVQALKLLTTPVKRLKKQAPKRLKPPPRNDEGQGGGYVFRPSEIFKAEDAGLIKGRAVKVNVLAMVKERIGTRYTLADVKKGMPIGSIVNMAKVKKYESRILAESEPPYVYIATVKGKQALFDGNHRLFAAYRAGLKTIDGYAWDIKDLLAAEYVDASGVKRPLAYKQISFNFKRKMKA